MLANRKDLPESYNFYQENIVKDPCTMNSLKKTLEPSLQSILNCASALYLFVVGLISGEGIALITG